MVHLDVILDFLESLIPSTSLPWNTQPKSPNPIAVTCDKGARFDAENIGIYAPVSSIFISHQNHYSYQSPRTEGWSIGVKQSPPSSLFHHNSRLVNFVVGMIVHQIQLSPHEPFKNMAAEDIFHGKIRQENDSHSSPPHPVCWDDVS